MKTTDPQDELFPLVDENDKVIGSIKRKIANRSPHLYHRAVCILVFNESGELFLQKRSATKDTGANEWSPGVSGHVQHKEEYLDAAIKETAEEIGVKIVKSDLQKLGKILVRYPNENEFSMVYKLTIADNTEIVFPKEEIAEVRYIELKELKGTLKTRQVKWSLLAIEVFRNFLAEYL